MMPLEVKVLVNLIVGTLISWVVLMLGCCISFLLVDQDLFDEFWGLLMLVLMMQ